MKRTLSAILARRRRSGLRAAMERMRRARANPPSHCSDERRTVYCWMGDTGLLNPGMKHVCAAPNRRTWFRIETEAEAERESTLMDHAVAKYFRRERETAVRSYNPTSPTYFEQNIGLQAHIARCRFS